MTFSRYLTHSTLVLAALLFLAATPAHADTVVLQTGFEADSAGTKSAGSVVGTGGADIGSGFTTSGVGVQIIQPCMPLTSRCLYMETQFVRNPPSITSVATFSAGDYQLTFDYIGSGANVSLGNFSQALPSSINTGTSFNSGVFSLGAPAQLIFSVPDDIFAVDNIRLTRIDKTASVPEPATMLLLGTGLTGLGGMIKRRCQGIE